MPRVINESGFKNHHRHFTLFAGNRFCRFGTALFISCAFQLTENFGQESQSCDLRLDRRGSSQIRFAKVYAIDRAQLTDRRHETHARNLIARSCRLARVLIRVPETLTVERTELRCQVVRIASKGRLADWALRVCPFGQQNEMPARTQRKSPPGGVNSWEFRLFERSAVKGGVKVGHWGGVKGSQ